MKLKWILALLVATAISAFAEFGYVQYDGTNFAVPAKSWTTNTWGGAGGDTNGLASTNWVVAQGYVTQSITNGLWRLEDGTNWVANIWWPSIDASAITAELIGHWDDAYGWGDHAGLYDLLGSAAAASNGVIAQLVSSNWISHASGTALYGSSNGQWTAIVIPPGDVTAAGDNVFSGSNTFSGTVSMTSNLLFNGSNIVGVASVDGILGSEADTVDGHHAVSFAILSSNNTFAGGTTQAFDAATMTNLTMRGGNIALGSGWMSRAGASAGLSIDSTSDATLSHANNADTQFTIFNYSTNPANRAVARAYKYGGASAAAPNASVAYTVLAGFYDGYALRNSGAFQFFNETTIASNNVPTAWSVSTGTSGRSERIRVTSGGDILIGTTTAGNILKVVQSSSTDPIADSWTTYTCTRTEKVEVEPELNTGYLGRLAAWKTYRYQRLPIVRDDEVKLVTDGIMSARREAAEKTKVIVNPITSKEEDDIRVSLSAAKASAPKFNAVKVGPMIDDPETPKEIFSDGQNYISGIDMLAYIGFLHAALREEVAARESLEKRLAKLEEIVKP